MLNDFENFPNEDLPEEQPETIQGYNYPTGYPQQPTEYTDEPPIETFPEPDADHPKVEVYTMSPRQERKYTLRSRFFRSTDNYEADKKLEIETSDSNEPLTPESKSQLHLSELNIATPAYNKNREELAKAASKDIGQLRDRLVISWSSFAPRISSGKKGSLEVQHDAATLLKQWYGGSAYHPFRRSLKDNWPEAIDRDLPIKIITTRSPIIAPKTLPLIERWEKAFEYASNILGNAESIEQYRLALIRVVNDITTEFAITPSHKFSEQAHTLYSLMFREATMAFYNPSEAIKYKADHPYRPVSVLYSNALGLSPMDALLNLYLRYDILPFIDLLQIKSGVDGNTVSYPERATKTEKITWQEVFATLARRCSHIVVKGDPNGFKGTKRELQRTLNGEDTETRQMIEHIVNRTTFKGAFDLEIDPLLTQIRGKKAYILDQNIAFHFAWMIADLYGTRLPKPE